MRGHRIEAVGLSAPIAEIGRRYLQLRQSGMSFPNPHEFAGIAKRQRLNQDGIDDAEERGVGSDAQGNGENRGQREGRPAAKRSDGGAHFNSLRAWGGAQVRESGEEQNR